MMALPEAGPERLEIGRRVHEKEWPTVGLAAVHFGVKEYHIYKVLKEFRDSAGIETEAQKRAKISRLGSRGDGGPKPKPKPKGANGHGHLAPIPPSLADQARIRELEHQLAAAHDEVETLQKLLMTVGRAL